MAKAKRIKDIKEELARTQKNKATEKHLGKLKSHLLKLERQVEAAESATGPKGEGFDVVRYGDARVALIGYPSVGKSSFLNLVCDTESAVNAAEFTTLTTVPGLLKFKDTRIQLLDLPGIIEGASSDKGRGRRVIAVARSADLILMMLDSVKGEIQKIKLTKELYECGIRINQIKPDIYLRKKKDGGMKISNTVALTKTSKDEIKKALKMFKMHNCECVVRQDCTKEEIIDIVCGNRVYVNCLYLYNKIDHSTIEELNKITGKDNNNVVISVKQKLGIDMCLQQIWDSLNLLRIYSKKKGGAPDLNEPVIMKNGSTVKTFCLSIHKSIIKKFRYGLVWGKSAKHRPQQVGLNHKLRDEDVVQLVTVSDG